MFNEIFGYDDIQPVSPVKAREQSSVLPIDTDQWDLQKRTGKSDQLCQKLDANQLIEDVLGDSTAFVQRENGEIHKASAYKAAYVPTPTERTFVKNDKRERQITRMLNQFRAKLGGEIEDTPEFRRAVDSCNRFVADRVMMTF